MKGCRELQGVAGHYDFKYVDYQIAASGERRQRVWWSQPLSSEADRQN
jgi:hypothetical protein